MEPGECSLTKIFGVAFKGMSQAWLGEWGWLNTAADCLEIPWLYVTSIYPEATTGPMGVEGQTDRNSDTPQTAVPHLNHMWVERVHACPRVSQLTLSLSGSRSPMVGPRLLLHCWGSLHRWAALLACEHHKPIFPSSLNTPTWFPPPAPRVFSAATGLLQASCWSHRGETGASLALLPWNAELGSAYRDVFTKLD